MNIDNPYVYADWLEENGYDAELLRVTLALRELGPLRLHFDLGIRSLEGRNRYQFDVDGEPHDSWDLVFGYATPRPGYYGSWIKIDDQTLCFGDRIDLTILGARFIGCKVTRIRGLTVRAGPPNRVPYDYDRYHWLTARKTELSNKITLPTFSSINVRRRPFA